MEPKDDPDLIEHLSLSQPLVSLSLQHQFLNAYLDTGIQDFKYTDNGFQVFFNRLETLRRRVSHVYRSYEPCNYGQLLGVAEIIRNEYPSRRDLLNIIRTKLDGELPYQVTTTLMDLAASLLTLMVVGPRLVGDIVYDDPVEWEADMTLQPAVDPGQRSLVNTVFPAPRYADTVKLPQSFTAANLEKIAGIQVRWTSNLNHHLLLRDDDTKVMLFHHVSALQFHGCGIFPIGFIDETLRTISLLVPPSLGEANPWFRQEQQKHRLDERAGLCDRLNSSERRIDKFYFWRERLVLLKRTYDDAEPKTLSQLWVDDRKKTQWFTFWVAVLVFIMTIFFGVIQSVASIIQAWASVKALRAQH